MAMTLALMASPAFAEADKSSLRGLNDAPEDARDLSDKTEDTRGLDSMYEDRELSSHGGWGSWGGSGSWGGHGWGDSGWGGGWGRRMDAGVARRMEFEDNPRELGGGGGRGGGGGWGGGGRGRFHFCTI